MAFRIGTVSLSTFNETLSRYPAAVPDKLRNLDEERYDTIPTAIAHSKQEDSDVYLLKPQVETLVEWKLCVYSFPSPHDGKADDRPESTVPFGPSCYNLCNRILRM